MFAYLDRKKPLYLGDKCQVILSSQHKEASAGCLLAQNMSHLIPGSPSWITNHTHIRGVLEMKKQSDCAESLQVET